MTPQTTTANAMADGPAGLRPLFPHLSDDESRRYEQKVRQHHEQEAARRLQDLLRSFTPPRYRRATLDNYEVTHEKQAKMLAQVRGLAARIPDLVRDGSPLVFFGPPGTGKDHVLVSLLRIAAVDFGMNGLKRVDGAELYRWLSARRRWDDGTRDWRTEVERCENATVLAVSDPLPPMSDPSPNDVANLLELLNHRYNAGKPTWMTMNADPEAEIKDRLSPQVYDRLRHGGHFLRFYWPSYRSAGKGEP